MDGLLLMQKNGWPTHTLPNASPLPSLSEHDPVVVKRESDHLTIPNDGTDVWEIDPQLLKFESKIASGSYGDL